MGRPFNPRKFPNFNRATRDRGPYFNGPRLRSRRPSPFVPTLVTLALITFLIVFQTDLGGPGRPAESLVRARPAVAVSAPFSGCNEARAAGAAPVYRGDPGFGEHLDGDGDGVGCEPYRR